MSMGMNDVAYSAHVGNEGSVVPEAPGGAASIVGGSTGLVGGGVASRAGTTLVARGVGLAPLGALDHGFDRFFVDRHAW